MKVDPFMVPVTRQIAEMPIFRRSGLLVFHPGRIRTLLWITTILYSGF